MTHLARDGGQAARPPDLADRLQAVGFALACVYAVFLVTSAALHSWLVDADGRLIANDFVNLHAAGRLVLQGQAAAAYDWAIHRQMEVAVVGHDFEGTFHWPYPPVALFAAALVAPLPFVAAMLAWVAATLPLYVAAIRAIVGARAGIALACGFAAVPWTMSTGQNGFLTAALVGGALVSIERRPILAGILLGLLTYKPHFGILFPIALVAAGCWRVITAAAVTAIVLAAASAFAFGLGTWQAFFDSVLTTGNAVFSEGSVVMFKQQSLLGFVRWLGGSPSLAWTLHGLLTLACAVAVALVWRGRADFAIKAAALGTAVMLATPYLFIYDFPVLAVPMAFLVRLGLSAGFLAWELAGLAVASLLVLVFPFVPVASGLFATLMVAALVIRRICAKPGPAPALGAACDQSLQRT